ncbi:unnamed protein product [Acanthoscelides obtectus]|uniref:Immunoglobulin I-set domain-containing protein n=1 Tax=Acanthoscelides obtectus TaxID=200917 RepID=A0A9P0Q7Q8_ACAOB|nr:unnamed protein product [Acanthoscelides obtectus]CAK1685871.1 hypothetical protein AOBTE_LOCUS35682 [Acanthoscelides obtectus]
MVQNLQKTVRRLAETDFGNYRCVAKNALGEAEGSIRLYGTEDFCQLGLGGLEDCQLGLGGPEKGEYLINN